MPLTIKNTRELISPDKFKMKVLVYALPGWGKTTWMADAPKPLVAACEAGEGKGLLSVAQRGLDYFEPTTVADLEALCKGLLDKAGNYQTYGLDSATDMVGTFVKEDALRIPRSKGSSEKRSRGIPELDDYGVMAEILRRNLRELLSQDRHIVVTARMRQILPDPETGKGEFIVGPDLPGQMMLGATAMFDFVLCGLTRQYLKDPKDAKSRITERYFLTQPQGSYVAKCRANLNVGGSAQTHPLLASEEIFDPASGRGTFPALLKKIQEGYAKVYAELAGQAA